MERLSIYYEFSFNIALLRSNGKTRGNHSIIATGKDYRDAVWDMYFTLKKRRSTLIRVNSEGNSYCVRTGRGTQVHYSTLG